MTTIGEKFDSDFATAQNKLKFFPNFNGFAKVVKDKLFLQTNKTPQNTASLRAIIQGFFPIGAY